MFAGNPKGIVQGHRPVAGHRHGFRDVQDVARRFSRVDDERHRCAGGLRRSGRGAQRHGRSERAYRESSCRHIPPAWVVEGFTFGFFSANAPLGFGMSQNSRSHKCAKWNANATWFADNALPVLTMSAAVTEAGSPPTLVMSLSSIPPNFNVASGSIKAKCTWFSNSNQRAGMMPHFEGGCFASVQSVE